MAKRRINWKNVRKVGAVGLAALTVFSTLTWGGNVVQRGSGKVHAAGVPSIQDASSAVNYSTILGRATDFGIVADSFQQRMHMETTLAVDHFSNMGFFNTIDLISNGSTAQVMIGGIDFDKSDPVGPGEKKPVRIDGNVASTMNVEGSPDILTMTGSAYDNFYFQTDAQVLTTANEATSTNIQRILNNAFEESHTIEEKISNGYAIDYKEYIDNNGCIDLRGGDFTNKVVYIDVDDTLMSRIGSAEQMSILKDDSTVVVFNINDNVSANHTWEDLYTGDPITGIRVNKYKVSIDGGNTWAVSDKYSGNSEDPTDDCRMNDHNICQKVIWNITTTLPVGLDNSSGLFIIPNSPLAETLGTCAGWVVAKNFANSRGEWHYIYHGGNQDVLKDGVGQIHFAGRKAFTHEFDGANTIEDTTVYNDANAFTFYWYETEANHDISGKIPVKEIKNTATNKLQFPILEFFVDETKAINAGFPDNFIPENDSKEFHYSIYEKNGGTVDENGFYHSNGYIDIDVLVRNVSNKLQYYVTTKTVLDDGSVYKENKDIRMSGIEFSLGAFFNKSDASINLKKTVTGECDAAKTATYTYYVQDAAGNYYDVKGVNKGTTKTGILVTAGQTVTVKGLPNGTYTVSEDIDSAIKSGYTLDVPESKEAVVDGITTASVNLTNNYTQTKLTVKKKVAGTFPNSMRNKEYKFYVIALDYSDENAGTYTYLDQYGNLSSEKYLFSVEGESPQGTEIIPRIAGNYKVEEDLNSVGTPDGYTLDVSYKNQTVELSSDNKNADSEITNTFMEEGKFAILIDKKLDGVELKPEKDFEFLVSYTDDSVSGTDKTVYIDEKGEKQATYSGHSEGWSWVQDVIPVKRDQAKTIKVKANTPTIIRRTNNNDLYNGLWGNEYAASTTYTIEEVSTGAITQVTGADGGVYYLTQKAANQTTTLDANNVQPKLTFTNKYEACYLEIEKQANIDALNGTACEVTVKNSKGEYIGSDGKAGPQEKRIPINVGETITLKGTGIVAGETYTVTEVSPAINDVVIVGGIKYKLTATSAGSAALDEANLHNKAVVTNTYEEVLGRLSITKTATGLPSGTAYPTFSISVVGPNVNTTFDLANGETKELTGLRLGRYTISENKESAQVAGYNLVVTGDDGNVITLTDETNQTAEVINTYTEDTEGKGSIKITKDILGDVTANDYSNHVYTFLISGESLGENPKTVTITGKDSVVVPDLKPGTYTVTEQGTGEGGSAQIAGYTLAVTGSGQTVTVNKDEVAPVTITNTYTEKQTGKLTVTKAISGTGFDADKAFEVVITLNVPAGENLDNVTVSSNGTLSGNVVTAHLKNTAKVVIDNLPAGTTYTVVESPISTTDQEAGYSHDEADDHYSDANKEIDAKDSDEVTVVNAYSVSTTGSLKITKNVTVNGNSVTSTEMDGTYKFAIKDSTDAVIKTAQIVIANGVSKTVEIDELNPGTYTIEEIDIPDEVTVDKTSATVTVVAGKTGALVPATAMAEFTNNKGVVTQGSLVVEKAVTVNGNPTTGTEADGTYTFDVKKGTTVVDTLTIKITNGVSNTAESKLLDAGEYVVTERASDNGTTLTGNNDLAVTVVAGKTGAEAPKVSFTNNKEVATTGSLKITKNVTVNNSAVTDSSMDGTYKFSIKDATGAEVKTAQITITNGASNTVEVTELAAGTYTIEETDIPTGVTVDKTSATATVVAGKTGADVPATAMVEFTNNKTVATKGSIQITKNVQVNGANTTGTEADGTYTFYVMQGTEKKGEATITITNGVSNTATVSDLEPGDYTVVEQNVPTDVTVTNDQTATVVAGQIANVSFTNDKAVETKGKIRITKNVKVNGANTTGTEADGTYTFYVMQGTEKKGEATITITNGVSNIATVLNLDPGDYTVVEQNVPTDVTVTNDQVATVVAGQIANVSFTNDKAVETKGSLKITKKVTVNNSAVTDSSMDGTYKFSIKDATGAEVKTAQITITNGASNTVEVTELAAGTYTIEETDIPTGVTVDKTSATATVVAGKTGADVPATAMVEFTNNKTVATTGSLKITKKVTVNNSAVTDSSMDGTYKFSIKDATGAEVKTAQITITNGASNTVEVTELAAGTYTIEETDIPTGVTVDKTSATATVVAGKTGADVPATAMVEFTNNKTVATKGSIQITKNVQVNGANTTGTEADGTYTFYVMQGTEKKGEATITITNGVSNTATVSDLEPGDYTVVEQNVPTDVTVTNDQTATVVAGQIANVSFTNDKAVETKGKIRITKNVKVNGANTTGTEADGTYTFYVMQGTEKKGEATITITNGVSNIATVLNLDPGDYTVVEQNVPTDVTVTNDQVATVVAGQIANVSFTNDKAVETKGSLKITKKVTVNNSAVTDSSMDGTYKFSIKDATGAEVKTAQITITNGASNTVEVTELAAGTYTIEETDIPTGVTVDKTSATATVVAGKTGADVPATAMVEFTNNKTVTTTGSLKITKNVTVNNSAVTDSSMDGTYKFSIKDATGAEVKTAQITITNGASNTVEVTELAAGTYTIEETDIPTGVTVDKTSATATVVAGKTGADVPATAMVEFTNNKTVATTGSLKITKNVTVNGSAVTDTSMDGTYKFSIKDATGAEVKTAQITITNGASNTVEVTELAAGTYTIEETDIPNGVTVDKTSATATVVAGKTGADVPATAMVEFTNNKTVATTGSLKITKNVTVNGSAVTDTSMDGTYKFSIKDATGAEVKTAQITITNGASNTVEVTDLAAGTYTIEETDIPNGVTVDKTSATATVVAGKTGADVPATAMVEFTNNKTVATTGSLKITKKVTVNNSAVTDSSMDGTYKFSIKDATGAEVKTAQITITNGASNTVEVTDLAAGTYTIEETDIPNGVTVDKTSATATVVAGKTGADVPATAMVEFTNNKTVVVTGSLSINKTVTSNDNQASLAGKTIKISLGKDGKFLQADKTLGTKTYYWEVPVDTGRTITDVPVGTYTVNEDTDTAGITGYNLVTTGSTTSGPVTVTTGSTPATFTLINNYEKIVVVPDTGSLKLNKQIVLDGNNVTALPGLLNIKVTIKEAGGQYLQETVDSFGAKELSGTAHEWTVPVEGGITITNVPIGTYTVTELTTGLDVAKFVRGTCDMTASGSVTKGNETALTVTNRYTTAPGSISVKKTITSDYGTAPTMASINVIVKAKNENKWVKEEAGVFSLVDSETTISVPADGTEKVLTGIPVGEYTVTEVLDSEGEIKVTGYKFDHTSTTSANVTVASETVTKAELKNKYFKEASIEISKVDAVGYTGIGGADLTLYRVTSSGNEKIRSWTSREDAVESFTLTDGNYLIVETKVPTGYITKNTLEVTFTVNDGTVQTVGGDGELKSGNLIDFRNDPITVKISKVDATSIKEISGAKMQLSGPNGYLQTWTSDGKPKEFSKLEPGNYVLTETAAPSGYKKDSTEVKFTISEDGQITITSGAGSVNANGTEIKFKNVKATPTPGPNPGPTPTPTPEPTPTPTPTPNNTTTLSTKKSKKVSSAKTGENKAPAFAFGGSMLALLAGAATYVGITKKKREEEEEYHNISLK